FLLLSERDAPAEEVCTVDEVKVIEFGDSYEAPQEVTDTGLASEGSAKKKGRTIAVTTEDMQKRMNDTAQELWAAILKIFGGNEATKKTKKNQLKQQYGNFKAEGRETLEQTFNRLQAIVSHLEFMDVEIEQDDLNQKFLTILAPEWLMYTIMCRNRSDFDTTSLDDLYNHLKVYELEVQKKSESNSQNMSFISSAKNSSGKEEVNTAKNHALVADEEAPTEFALMAKSISENEVFDNSLCSKACKKNTDSLNTMITELSEKLSDTKTTLYHYKLGFSQVKARLVEFKNQEIKFCEKIRGLEFKVKSKDNRIERLTKEQEEIKKEKEGLDSKLTCFQSASKNLNTLLGSQRSDKNKEGLGYSIVPPPAQVYSPPKKDMSWTGLPEIADDTIIDYSGPSPSIESNSSDLQNSDSFVSEKGDSSDCIMSKPMIKFVKATNSPTEVKISRVKTVKKPSVKYVEIYRNTTKSPKVRGNQRNWNNLKTKQLGKDFVMKNKACLNVESLIIWPMTVITPMRSNRPNMNAAQPKRTSFSKPAHSYVRRPFQRTSVVRTQFRVPRVSTVNTKFPTLNKKFPTGNLKLSTADVGDKGTADSGCSRHMTGNISYLSDYEPYDRGYVSFGQGGGKITGKGIIKTGKLEFENMYFVKDLKYNMFSVSQIRDNKNSVLFTNSKCIALGREFKLRDDTNVLLRTPRQHNMYSIDLNNIIPHKDLTCLVAKASADESVLWHRRLGHLNFKTINKLVRHNLVRGLPSKCFKNNQTCVACLKGKQHKASYKTKLVHSVSKPLYTLHMDMFGPTSISSLNHKWYCLVVTDDFSRFTWTFFLKTKDDTSGILRNFITKIENLKELKVKIIRCDNEGEFRNKEMNDFCSKKGIKREFSNARTPKQNRVAEKRNKTLIEAAITMLADAKLPVTFWAEAVNTALVVAGTTSTNFSGTKDAASQDEKKDVYSLRYIALLNWLHEAHLESSTSNAQDTCNADAPESSGNSNPNVTLTNPLADHIETLILESPIPTISSPVPTACLDDSPDPSSDTRLISKRVTSQDDTPSLDNILTLSNRFEDILGITTNTGATNGVEVDLGNMENNISASPTPTFRIHKDHLKSQIIGPVDTPVQTRTKSKEMKEHSFIAIIHQKTNPTLL
nr:putative ribonuclease H-like domain-containing protein [Tanacetum cinerariifolium]